MALLMFFQGQHIGTGLVADVAADFHVAHVLCLDVLPSGGPDETTSSLVFGKILPLLPASTFKSSSRTKYKNLTINKSVPNSATPNCY